MKKFQIGILIILVAVTGFVAWYATSQKAEPPTTGQPLRIGVVPWIGDGVYYVAQAKGFFAQEKVNVEFVNVDDFAIAKELLTAGKVDAIYLTPETVAVLNDAGVKLKIVAANDLSAGADGIIATPDIKNIEDLKGKKVAFEIGSTSHFLLSYLLNQKGLTTKDLHVVEAIAPDAGATFVAGKVDAAVTWEPWLSKAAERVGGHLLISSKDAPVIFDMPILRAEVVDSRPQDVKAMLRAVFAAQKWISENKPEEVAKVIAGPLKISQQDAIDQMLGVHWPSYEENLNMLTTGTYSVKNSLQIAGDLWQKLGLIKNTVNTDEIVDASFLKNLYK